MIKNHIFLFMLAQVSILSLLSLDLQASDEEVIKDKPHHLSIFLGDTHVLDADEDGYTLGIDYEFRVNEILGLGTVIEHAAQNINATTILAVADIHTSSGLIIQVGPGYEFGDEDNNPLIRIGGLYEFEIGSYTISPQIHFDMVKNEDDSLVFGFAFGKAF